MAIRLGNKIGIEFHQQELRVIEIRAKGNDLSFGNLGQVPMDPGYLQAGNIINPQIVAERLRSFLDRQHINATDVIATFPTDVCTVRVLNLPKAPESELRSLVSGEIEHFGLVRQGGVYDFCKLANPAKDSAGTFALLMATDGSVITSIDKTLEMAGLRLVALEPTHIALFRAAYTLAARTDQTLFVTISEFRSDVSLLVDGKITFYRSFEVGSVDMAREQTSDSMFMDIEDPTSLAARYLNLESASTLAIEIRRSIEYFSREMPDLPAISHIAVASNSSAMQHIADWIQQSISLDTEFIRIPASMVTQVSSFSLEDSISFLTCFGLGMRDSQGPSKELPKMDLSLHEQLVSQLEISDRKARIGAYLSAGVLAAALIATGLMTMKANRAQDELESAKKDLKMTQDLERRRLADMQIRIDRLAMLQQEGIPVNPIVLGIGRSVPSQAGLSDLKLTMGKVDLSGEASAEDALVRLTRSLQRNNFVSNVSLQSFERLFDDAGSRGIRFKMSVDTIDPASAPAPMPENTEVAN